MNIKLSIILAFLGLSFGVVGALLALNYETTGMDKKTEFGLYGLVSGKEDPDILLVQDLFENKKENGTHRVKISQNTKVVYQLSTTDPYSPATTMEGSFTDMQNGFYVFVKSPGDPTITSLIEADIIYYSLYPFNYTYE